MIVIRFKTNLTISSGDTLKLVIDDKYSSATAYIKRKGNLRFRKVGTMKESEK